MVQAIWDDGNFQTRFVGMKRGTTVLSSAYTDIWILLLSDSTFEKHIIIVNWTLSTGIPPALAPTEPSLGTSLDILFRRLQSGNFPTAVLLACHVIRVQTGLRRRKMTETRKTIHILRTDILFNLTILLLSLSRGPFPLNTFIYRYS